MFYNKYFSNLLVVTIPPSPEVIDFNGWREKVETSECLHEPILIYLFLCLYSAPKAWQESSIIKKLYFFFIA